MTCYYSAEHKPGARSLEKTNEASVVTVSQEKDLAEVHSSGAILISKSLLVLAQSPGVEHRHHAGDKTPD